MAGLGLRCQQTDESSFSEAKWDPACAYVRGADPGGQTRSSVQRSQPFERREACTTIQMKQFCARQTHEQPRRLAETGTKPNQELIFRHHIL